MAGRIINALNTLVGKKPREATDGKSRRNGSKSNGHQPVDTGMDNRTQVVVQSTDPNVIKSIQELRSATESLITKQNERDLLGQEGKIQLANAIIKPLPGTELRMTRISRRTANLMAADITESALFSPKSEWPHDERGRRMDPAEVWRNAFLNLSVSIQGHQFDKVSDLAGLQPSADDEGTDHKYIGRIGR